MRQSDDPKFATILRRIHFHESTLKDIKILNNRIDISLEYSISISIIIHHHRLHDALNKERLQIVSQTSDVSIIHFLSI